MTIPYTYKIKCLPTNQWYYGVRWARGCNPTDLWTTYFTSSGQIKKLIQEFGKDAFVAKVSRVFGTNKEAQAHEHRFLNRTKAATNGAFINKANGGFHFSPHGNVVIHNIATQRETWHDPGLPIPEGWKLGVSDVHRKNNSECRKGREAHNKGKPSKKTGPCQDSRREAIRLSRLNTKKITCEFCSKETDPGNFKRYHGTNCKHNPNRDPEYTKYLSELSKQGYEKQLKAGKFNNFGRAHQEQPDTQPQSLSQFFQE